MVISQKKEKKKVNLLGVIDPAQSPVIKYAIVLYNYSSLFSQKLLSHPVSIIFTFFYSIIKIKNLKVTFSHLSISVTQYYWVLYLMSILLEDVWFAVMCHFKVIYIALI